MQIVVNKEAFYIFFILMMLITAFYIFGRNFLAACVIVLFINVFCGVI